MKPTDGMVRGMKAVDTGGPITMPVGEQTLGRAADDRAPGGLEVHRTPRRTPIGLSDTMRPKSAFKTKGVGHIGHIGQSFSMSETPITASDRWDSSDCFFTVRCEARPQTDEGPPATGAGGPEGRSEKGKAAYLADRAPARITSICLPIWSDRAAASHSS